MKSDFAEDYQVPSATRKTKIETKPVWKLRWVVAFVRCNFVAFGNLLLIASTVFLTVTPPLLLTMILSGLVLNALLSIAQLFCTYYGVQNRLRKLQNLTDYFHNNANLTTGENGNLGPLEDYTANYWSAKQIKRIYLALLACSVALITAACALYFLPLPIIASISLIAVGLIALIMKPPVYSATKDKNVDYKKLFLSIATRAPILALLILPTALAPFVSVPVLLGVSFVSVPVLLRVSLAARAATTTDLISNEKLMKYICCAVLFCAVALVAHFAAPPVVIMLASLLLVNVCCCFTDDSLMNGLHKGIKLHVFEKYPDKKYNDPLIQKGPALAV